MTQLAEMIATHPHVRGATNDLLIQAAELARDCAAICQSCADACLGGEMVQDLVQCIRLNLDCADICHAFANVASRRSGGDVPVIDVLSQACEAACRRCAQECEEHAGRHEHCRICAEACRACAEACHQARQTLFDTHEPAPAGNA